MEGEGTMDMKTQRGEKKGLCHRWWRIDGRVKVASQPTTVGRVEAIIGRKGLTRGMGIPPLST